MTAIDRCDHCGVPGADLITDARVPVCPPCVASLGRVVGDPLSVPAAVRERLLARSLDVVGLVRGQWAWTASWPGTGDDQRMRGGSA